MTSFNRKIHEVGFIVYDIHDEEFPIYYDNIHELLKDYNLRIRDIVYKFNHSRDDYVFIKQGNTFKKLYYVE